MRDIATWRLPFFEDRHRELAARAAAWRSPVAEEVAEPDLPEACRAIAHSLGEAGLLEVMVPRPDGAGGASIDLRAVCVLREVIAYHSVLADTVVAMQGIGTGAIWQNGSAEQKARYLDPSRAGAKIAAFALTEPRSGSDVAALETRAERDGNGWVINGDKTYISNAPFADHYVVVARTGEAPGAKGLSAFLVDAGTKGLEPGPAQELIAPHPVGPLAFRDCRVDASTMIGEPGQGFRIAMATFDIFRASVGAAALGMARRAQDEVMARITTRELFGGKMAQIAGVQTALADSAVDLDLAELAVYRAAWLKDTQGGRCSREVSMAKLAGTEAAQAIIDRAVQIFGGAGVTRGCVVEQLYREVRASRIYEGASEVQKIVIARSLLAERA